HLRPRSPAGSAARRWLRGPRTSRPSRSMAVGQLTTARLLRVNGALLAALALSVVGAAAIGPVHLDWTRAFDPTLASPDAVILLRTRVPRVLMAAIVGGALATAGAALQALLRNPLADPHLLGVSSGAALAGVCALVLRPVLLGHTVVVPAAAFGGALASMAIVVGASRVGGRLESYTL